ncbi:tellurite resistance TerB family protein [Vreelandella salicampi]|uniref:Tellurite resistance TerB family protein n=1 Tax=Vreelandella salicampi TaxID=1449798 RepID=A0A7Z0RU64_9GAMM|nr:tellurite resistance TerB family protein [Halomonas salicampi]NYS60247.1 tellurite resistance TerB family protein [Halomonas salicampi]
MNASKILQQLMQQAGGSQKGSGVDVQGMLSGLSKQFGGGSQEPSRQQNTGGSSSGFDMKSLLGGGAMGLLVGSKRGRKLGGKALKYGAIAGVGVLAWKAWQNSQQNSQQSSQQNSQQGSQQISGQQAQDANEGERVEVLSGEFQERRSLELLQAMIMAARADGHIDEQEQVLITQQIDALGADQEMHRWVEQQLQAPLDANVLAREADSPQAAREMYLVSVAVIDEQNPMERAWLDQLAKALNLSPDVAAELEHHAQQAG